MAQKQWKDYSPKQKKIVKIALWSLLALFVFIIVIAAVADNNQSASTQNTSPEQSEQEETANNLKVGDSVTMGNLTHTLHGVRWDNGGEFSKPEEGTRWLVADIELKNNGSNSESISTLLMWSLLDSEKRSADVQFGAETKGSLDKELGAGRNLRGEIAYNVTMNGDNWELVFEPNIFGFGQAIYKINASDIQ